MIPVVKYRKKGVTGKERNYRKEERNKEWDLFLKVCWRERWGITLFNFLKELRKGTSFCKNVAVLDIGQNNLLLYFRPGHYLFLVFVLLYILCNCCHDT